MNKAIFVTGEDYSAVHFEDYVREHKLSFSEAYNLGTVENDEYFFEVETKEFGHICPEFLDFVLCDIQDYEDSKDKNFYFSNDEIFKHDN